MVVNDFLLWSAWWLTSANKFIYNREIWDLNYKEISNTWHSFVLLAYFKQFWQPFLENKSFTHAFSYFLFSFLLDLITKPQTQHSASCKTRIKQNLRNATSTRNIEIMIVLYCCANTCCGLIHRYPSKLQHTGLRNNRNHCFKRKHVKS